MIKRSYFYSGFVERLNCEPDNFDGIISLTSFLPNPLLVWQKTRKYIEMNSMACTDGQKVIIKTMVRI